MPLQTAVLRGWVYLGHQEHSEGSQHSAQTPRSHGGEGNGNPLGGHLCKNVLLVSGGWTAGGQAGSLYTFTSWCANWCGWHAASPPQDLLQQMAANQAVCPCTLQASKSSSLSRGPACCGKRKGHHGWTGQLCSRPSMVWPTLVHVPPSGRSLHISSKRVSRDVAAMCRDCQQYQRGKVHKQPPGPLHGIPFPAHRFSHMHVDIVPSMATLTRPSSPQWARMRCWLSQWFFSPWDAPAQWRSLSGLGCMACLELLLSGCKHLNCLHPRRCEAWDVLSNCKVSVLRHSRWHY